MTRLRDVLRRALQSALARPGRTALTAFGIGLAAAAALELLGALDSEARARRLQAPRIPFFTASAGDRASAVSVVALGADEVHDASLELAEGRLFADLDTRAVRGVAVLGARARAELFGPEPALGASVEIAGERFTVIGLLATGAFHATAGALDGSVVVPAHEAPAAHARAGAGGDASAGTSARPRGAIDLALRGLLAASSALFGAAVRANAMLATGLERAREVALRRLVGATRREVRSELWLEAILQALVGGVAGVLAVLGLHALGFRLPAEAAGDPPAWAVPLALAASLCVGAAGG